MSRNQANYCPVHITCILTQGIVKAEDRLKIIMKHTPYNAQHIPPQATSNQQGFWSQIDSIAIRQSYECKQGQ
ncbi:hypothetical protein [Photobacterium kishitanii]|uniref:hypothetical protein n=1 Tax=Photobacterium kishitanii TaxID=318456 RepID=UPI0011B206C9|nr:hypothetical protein [Photobacterium kishitanii]